MYIVCGVLLAIALVTDLRSMKIPNKLTLPGIVVGLVFNTIFGGWHGFYLLLLDWVPDLGSC